MASLTITDDIKRVLSCALLPASGVGQQLKDMAASCSNSDTIPWKTLRAVVQDLRRADPSKHSGLLLHEICRGSSLQLPSPPQRVKHPDLIARNIKLQEQLDNKRYAAMVADVTVEERAAEDRKDALLPSSRLQIGFGLQVLVTMGTFFALAYIGTKFYLRLDELWAGLAGALGMTFGLLLETALLIVRTNMPKPLHEKYPELFPELQKKKILKAEYEEAQRLLNESKKDSKLLGNTSQGSAAPVESKKKR